MIKGLGKSQQAILDYVKALDRPVDATEVGFALYEKTSSLAWIMTFWSKARISKSWAQKLINKLYRRGYLRKVEPGDYYVATNKEAQQ